MFRVINEPQFTIRVPIKTPVDDGHIDETLKATFRVLTTDQLEAFDLRTDQGTRDMLDAAVVRLDDLVNDEELPIEYSDKVKQHVLSLPYARLGLAKAYGEAVTKVARGN